MLITIILIYLLNFFSVQISSKQEKRLNAQTEVKTKKKMENEVVTKTEAEWKKLLSPEAYKVLRENGTEAPFSGAFYKNTEKGTYFCAACKAELFSSDTKYNSGCGWPSFFDLENKDNVKFLKDTSLGMLRTEIRCKKCDSHLGHVFDDGPKPTGLRYCINSVALEFKKR